MIVQACTLFYSSFRLQMIVNLTGSLSGATGPTEVRLLIGDSAPQQTATCRLIQDEEVWEIVLEALVDRDRFPSEAMVEITRAERTARIPVSVIIDAGQSREEPQFVSTFRNAIHDLANTDAPQRPTLLDIGGRARSGTQRSEDYPHCDVTTFDILDQKGVDVVGDAHELSRYFPPSSFDFAMSIAVFEHLAMPWKVAVEMGKVLKVGGLAYIITHQTVGMHELPWDFFRFSDSTWPALFNRFTGFEVIGAQMSAFQHIVPRIWEERYRKAETAGGFEGSAVLVRKIGEPTVDWAVRVPDIIGTMYPSSTAI